MTLGTDDAFSSPDSSLQVELSLPNRLSPDSIEFACSFASRVGFHVGDLSYHYHEVPDKALILWFNESMSLFFVFRSASDSFNVFTRHQSLERFLVGNNV